MNARDALKAYDRVQPTMQGEAAMVMYDLATTLRSIIDLLETETDERGITWWEWIDDGLGGDLYSRLKQLLDPEALKDSRDAIPRPEDALGRVKVVLLKGPFNGMTAHLSRTPSRIEIRGSMYALIADPDTGAGLGAYAYVGEIHD